jgi:hypothetical protein
MEARGPVNLAIAPAKTIKIIKTIKTIKTAEHRGCRLSSALQRSDRGSSLPRDQGPSGR